jgi:hypothetical protein
MPFFSSVERSAAKKQEFGQGHLISRRKTVFWKEEYGHETRTSGKGVDGHGHSFPGGFSDFRNPPAAAKTLTPAQYPDQCVALNRNVSLHQPAVADYKCQYKDEKLLIDTSGSMAPAPEGVYKTSKGGKECLVGKGGLVLACIR